MLKRASAASRQSRAARALHVGIAAASLSPALPRRIPTRPRRRPARLAKSGACQSDLHSGDCLFFRRKAAK